jgi:GNAT superfamily N-acetyltransferase
MSGEDGTAGGRELRVRQARHGDRDDVAAISERTWPERDGDDYLADVFADWVDGDGPDQRTFVAETDAGIVGVVQAVRLSPYEAWYQGMRVHPDHRRRGVSDALNRACVEWSRDRGATVGRLMVFSWNTSGLGAARAKGFEPTTEFRWMQPDPDPDAAPDARIAEDPDGAYAFWAGSRARDHL